MYDNSNAQWFSQTLLVYKDKSYATNGYLRLSISTNTEDFKFFNPPTLNLSISNNYQRSINLNIQNTRDLIRAFKTIQSQLNGNELTIQRKYQRDVVLFFTFKVDPNNSNRIVVIEIRNNETDFTKIIVPLENIFESIASCIREFTENYMALCSQLLIQSIQSQATQIVHQLPSLIKGISSQIVSQIPVDDEISDSRVQEIEEGTINQTQATIDDLDKFLGEDMGNVDIPELNREETEKLVEIDSLFVKNFINGDIANLESAMTNYFMTPAPLLAVASDLKSKIGGEIKDEDFTTLPGIKDEDLKSLVYLTKLFPTITYKNYLESSVPVPSTTPVFKYSVEKFSEVNLEIAYDLFLFNLYVRTARRRLETKIEDAIESKALFNTQLRFFTDPFVFSFIDKVDKSKILSIILTRYKYYKSIGVFDSYINLLSQNRCPEITENDISSVIDEAIEKVVGKSPYIDKLHENLEDSNSLRVRSKNTFSLEQIINEILPLEIAEKIGKDLKNDNVLEELKQKYQISDEILTLFKTETKKSKKKTTTTVKRSASNLERLIRTQFIDEVPKQYQEPFMNYLVELGDKKFDLENSKFPIDEFGDNVIKALYLWDPENDPVVSKNYKQFYLKVENELMERDLILTKTNSEEKNEIEGDWDFLLK